MTRSGSQAARFDGTHVTLNIEVESASLILRGVSERIEKASDTQLVLAGNMGVDHGGPEVRMTHQFLNSPDIVSTLNQVCGK